MLKIEMLIDLLTIVPSAVELVSARSSSDLLTTLKVFRFLRLQARSRAQSPRTRAHARGGRLTCDLTIHELTRPTCPASSSARASGLTTS